MVRITLKNAETKVASLVLDTEKEVMKSVEIVPGKEVMAKLYFPKIEQNPTYSNFEALFKAYINDKTETKLVNYLKILADGDTTFKTKAKRNLIMDVERI
jgi:hypothetical protein